MLPNIGREDFHDRPVIFFRLLGDSFQGMNSAEAELEPRLSVIVNCTELFDCFRETLGDLPLLDCFKICPV